MNIKVEPSAGYTIVIVDGRLDTTNAGEFEKTMNHVLDGGCTKLILDCWGLKYISSSGLRIFLVAQKKITLVKGQFILCSLQPEIKEIFDISGFSSIFSILPDKETSIRKLQ